MYAIGNLNGNGATLTNYSKAKTLKDFALIRLNVLLREEGKVWAELPEYCKEWLDVLNENSDGQEVYTIGDVPMQAADNIVYTNAHYYNNRECFTSEEKTEMYNHLVERLTKAIENL